MIITLTTDFGTADSYVGQMKGVILGIAPHVTIVDLSHEVPAQDIMAGALVLESAVDHFPKGTIHVVVVDPGVGTDRAPIAVQTERFVLIGPDNGVLSAALARDIPLEAVQLTNTDYHNQPVSNTFHGRDIFAAVAAHIANGAVLGILGDPVEHMTQLDLPPPADRGHGLELHVLSIDHFGNLITNLTFSDYQRWCAGRAQTHTPTIRIGNHQIDQISRTFDDAPTGGLVAYFGSSGRLEIAVDHKNAAQALGAKVGTNVYLGQCQ